MGAERVPLSYNQVRRLKRDAMFSSREPHHISAVFDGEGELSETAMRQAIRDVIARHEALRTAFRTASYGAEPYGLLLPVEPRADLLLIAESGCLEDLTRQATNALFDLEHDYKLRVTLVRRTPGAWRLIVTVEHLICDGQSFDRVLADLATAYNARLAGDEPFHDLVPGFATWAEQERAALDGPLLEAHLAFWRTRLDPLEAIPEVRLAGMAEPSSIPAELAGARMDLPGVGELRALCARNGVSLHTGMLACLKLAVFAVGRQSVVGVVGPVSLPSDDRGRAVGWFSNLAVFRSRIDPAASAEGLLRATQQTVFDTLDHLIPLPLLVQHLQPERDKVAGWRPWLYFDSDWWEEDPLPLNGAELARVDEACTPALRPGVGLWANGNAPIPHVYMQWEAEVWPEAEAHAFLSAFVAAVGLLARSPDATCAELARTLAGSES
ncbi:condensation domain-containing protein [Nonomuraea sp. NPDC048881]|uniref:condensation domain-containing protein n=1 Tax=Nonomuraea sp. NPDC048881 TaxID=3155030 RepID=UPI00340C7D0D